jgi:hypothetical protein
MYFHTHVAGTEFRVVVVVVVRLVVGKKVVHYSEEYQHMGESADVYGYDCEYDYGKETERR